MLIEFECTNLLDFDQAAQKYVTCNAKIVVSDDKIGQLVRCDRCGQTVEVPLESLSEVNERDSVPAKQSKKQLAPAAATSANDSSDEFRLMDPIERPPVDVMVQEFDQSTDPEIFQGKKEKCPKCGSAMDDFGNCTECRYVEKKYDSENVPFDKLELRPAGFQKWFLDMMSEGIPLPVLFMAMHVLVLLFSIAMFTVSFFVGMPTSALLGVGIVAFIFLYAGFVFKGYQLARNPNAKLAWFQRIAWNGILAIARLLKWQGYDPRFKNRLVIDLRGEGIVDDKVYELPGLNKVSVLDLEGTLISDKSLRALYGLNQLYCVVLLKTKVTHEAVVRLQQANPRLWIWY